MYDVIQTALVDFMIYSLLVVIYTLVGAYQNINIWKMSFDWKIYLNGLVKWLVLGGSVVGSVVGAFMLLAQANSQGIQIVNAEAVAPRVIFGVVLIASGIMLGKIVSKLATTMGVSEETLRKIQEQAVSSDADKPLVLNIDALPMPSDDYIQSKIKDEQEGGVGAFYSVPIDSYQSFRNAVLGHGFDIDNYCGFQCWDGTALLWQQLGKSLVTGNGLAIGAWDLKRDVNKYDQFDLVADVNALKVGDVVAMRPNHIGFFEGFDGGYMVILGQNQGGSPASPNGGTGFNVARVAKTAFAGAFRYRNWNNVSAPTPAPTPAPAPQKSVDEVAREVLRGDWGNGEDRKARLAKAGYDFNTVQAKVNELLGGIAPAPKPVEKFAVGDRVVPTRRVSYGGTPLTQYDPSYTITELKGDRAVLSARGSVWSAMNTSDLRKA